MFFQQTPLLRALFSNLTADDPYLRNYLSVFPFGKYSIYYVENRDAYYVETITEDALKNGVIKKGGLWERHIYDLLGQYTQPGSIALDIGGHIGTHTLALSRFVGDEGSVHVFEPQIKLFSEIVINMHLNKCNNVVFHRRALGNVNKWAEMQPTTPWNEGNTLVGKGGDKVQMVRLDDFHFTNVSVIKIDVEGFEEKVLEGAKETILLNKPVMLIELWVKPGSPQIHAIERLGYKAVHILNSDFLFLPISK